MPCWKESSTRQLSGKQTKVKAPPCTELVQTYFVLVLKNVRGDVDAVRCKAFALLRRMRFADVVSVTSGMVDERLKFYGAYAHYRCNNWTEALKSLNSMKEIDGAVMELKGQILYKQGNFSQAKYIFEQCMTQYKVGNGSC